MTDTEYQNIIICSGDSVYSGGAWQYSSGVFFDSYTNQNACDSTVITQITDDIFDCNTNYVSICQGQGYYIGGVYQTQSGSYWENIITPAGCPYSCETYLSVIPLPVVDIGSALDTLCWESQNLYTILDAGNPGASYLWSTGDTTQQVEIWGEDLGYLGWSTVSVIVTQDNCSATDSIVFWVDICEGIPGTERSRRVPLLYPNPTSGIITISNSAHAIITIMDITGKDLLKTKIEASETSFDLSRFASGTYFVKIISSEKVHLLKLLIRK
ncbi:MAG: hypothetical protein A2X01_20535 [Bacteroidetes bacterium GWF2_35_48]|nr:MAG: hypothetical protein A2X01_20535 [Bacteroidetes bacterium GWF2_35_48]